MNESPELKTALEIGVDLAEGKDKTVEQLSLSSSEPKADSDLPPVDVVDLDTEEIDLEKVDRELKKAENELIRLVMDKCPKCGESLTYINDEPHCLPCMRRKMGVRTIRNSTAKVENLITIYKMCILKHKRPSISMEMFSTLIPQCLLKVDIDAEILLIHEQKSQLHANERKFILLYEDLKQMYFAAVLEADMYEKQLADQRVTLQPEPSPFAKEEHVNVEAVIPLEVKPFNLEITATREEAKPE